MRQGRRRGGGLEEEGRRRGEIGRGESDRGGGKMKKERGEDNSRTFDGPNVYKVQNKTPRIP
jgi:hypothetical protein